MSDAEGFKRKVVNMIGIGIGNGNGNGNGDVQDAESVQEDEDVREEESAQEDEPGPDPAVPLDRWRALPARVRVEDQSSSVPASDAPDPEGGRNPDNDWLLRGV